MMMNADFKQWMSAVGGLDLGLALVLLVGTLTLAWRGFRSVLTAQRDRVCLGDLIAATIFLWGAVVIVVGAWNFSDALPLWSWPLVVLAAAGMLQCVLQAALGVPPTSAGRLALAARLAGGRDL